MGLHPPMWTHLAWKMQALQKAVECLQRPSYFVVAAFATIHENAPLLVFSRIQDVVAFWTESKLGSLAFCRNAYPISWCNDVFLFGKGITESSSRRHRVLHSQTQMLSSWDSVDCCRFAVITHGCCLLQARKRSVPLLQSASLCSCAKQILRCYELERHVVSDPAQSFAQACTALTALASACELRSCSAS